MAVAKLTEAERAKDEMENELKHKQQELQKRSRPRFQDSGSENVIPMGVTHRGPGAFARVETMQHRKAVGSPKSSGSSTDSRSLPTSPSDTQVPGQQDSVPTASPTAPGTAEDACCPCPSGTEATETTDNTSPDATWEDGRLVDDGQSDQHPDDENKEQNDNDAVQQLQPAPPSEAGVNDHLLTAST